MQPFELTPFLHKYAAGEHTEAEHRLFIEWLKTATEQEIDTALTQSKELIFTPGAFSSEPALPLPHHIEAYIQQSELGKPIHPVKIHRIRRYATLAAACLIFLLAGTSVWLLLDPTQDKESTVEGSVHRKEVKPGGNKALLTLGNGDVLNLDHVENGQVAVQGNVIIQKSSNGQLVYKDVKNDQLVNEIAFNILTTPRGGQFKLTLPDGSDVWLNAASSIKYPTLFSGKERRVALTGEAYFEIAHRSTMPFIVSINGTEIKVLGTHFNVNGYADEPTLKTSLLEGSIQLTKNNSSVMLEPGQQAQIVAGDHIDIVDQADMDEAVAWKNGYFSFNRASLPTVMRQISRWYDVEVRYEGKVPVRFFGGKIDRNSNAPEVLKILEESNIHFTLEGNHIIVKP